MRPASRRLTMLGTLMLSMGGMLLSGCDHIHGRPVPGPEVVRPEEVLDFPTLYQQNCAACHGTNGKGGVAISLANPVYLAVSGEGSLQNTIAKGVSGKLMPPFAQSAGGMLTDRQIEVLTKGILQTWGTPNLLDGQNPPAYTATQTGDAVHGQQAFTSSCARCHGDTGEGAQSGSHKLGSIVDPSYLSLISDQDLRGIIIAGRPDEGMPDWRSDSSQPLTDQQITDIVTWLGSKRVSNPGQPYRTRP